MSTTITLILLLLAVLMACAAGLKQPLLSSVRFVLAGALLTATAVIYNL